MTLPGRRKEVAAGPRVHEAASAGASVSPTATAWAVLCRVFVDARVQPQACVLSHLRRALFTRVYAIREYLAVVEDQLRGEEMHQPP